MQQVEQNSTCGNYKIHTFTSDGTFNVTSAGTPNASSAVDFGIIGGGGGGGKYQAGGGGGGYRESKFFYFRMLDRWQVQKPLPGGFQ